MQLIQSIETARAKARIPKRKLCKTAGIHVETYRRVRLKLVSPTLRTIEKLEGALSRLTQEAAE